MGKLLKGKYSHLSNFRVGSVAVRIYPRHRKQNGANYRSWLVADLSSGHRKLVKFSDETEPRNRARKLATRLTGRESDVLTLTCADVLPTSAPPSTYALPG